MRQSWYRLSLFSFVLFFWSTSVAFAVGSKQPVMVSTSTSPQSLATSPTNPNLMYCATYFPIGSVQVNVTPIVTSTVAGAPITFSGTIENANAGPIVDGQVYVKVFFKNQKHATDAQKNGYQLVDQFLAVDHIALAANAKKPVTFSWNVPVYAQSGDYEIATYYTSANRYNMSGLTFTDDITGATAAFSVLGSAPATSFFDKNTVTLNGTAVQFANFIPSFTKDEAVTARVTLINPRSVDTVVAVTWKLYSWDFVRSEYLRDSSTELIALKANERKVLSHPVMAIPDPVSLLVVEAKERDTKSLLNIRFARAGIAEARSNRLMLLTYPLKKGEQNALFACVHSESSVTVPQTKLTLTIRDTQGNVVHSYVYTGDIGRNVMGIKNAFVPTQDLTDFTLSARLEQPNHTPENVVLTYACNDIDPALCPSAVSLTSRSLQMVSSPQGIAVVVLVILMGVAVGVLLKRKKQMV